MGLAQKARVKAALLVISVGVLAAGGYSLGLARGSRPLTPEGVEESAKRTETGCFLLPSAAFDHLAEGSTDIGGIVIITCESIHKKAAAD